MSREEVFESVNEAMRDVFEDEEIVAVDETTAKDIEGWDSLTHISLMDELETIFGIRFTMAEVQELNNVGELVSAIIKHLDEK